MNKFDFQFIKYTWQISSEVNLHLIFFGEPLGLAST